MSLIQAIILGFVQGLTEFIPVSSSGHLIIMQRLLGVETAGLTFDVALHIGTLLALLIFFWRDIWQLARALVIKTEQTKLAWLIAAATLPAVIGGMLLQDLAETAFRSLLLVACTLIAMATFMLLAEHFAKRWPKPKKLEELSTRQALLIGAAQTLALIPGISRSGSTITAGIFSGLNRVSAMRFSFLLAIPITAGAILKVLITGDAYNAISANAGIFISGIIAAALSGILAIGFLLRFLSRHGLHTFAYYRIVLGVVILIYLAAR